MLKSGDDVGARLKNLANITLNALDFHISFVYIVNLSSESIVVSGFLYLATGGGFTGP